MALAEPFEIARGVQTESENVVVELTHEGETGVGAAAPSTHYGETAATVEAVLPRLFDVLPGDPHDIDAAHAAMDRAVRDNPAAKAAVDIAMHDLAAKRHDLPLYRHLGLDPSSTPTSSFTVGLASTAEMARKAEAASDAGHDVLKLKLGTDRDREIVETLREAAPDVRLRVDANEAWTPKQAVRLCRELDGLVEFVEQPVPAENPEGMRRVTEQSPVPIAADESLVDPMAGSATIPTEAVLAATEAVPRPDLDPAFDALPGYDGERFRRLRDDHTEKSPTLDIEAREKRKRWRHCARVNREAAGVEDGFEIVEADAREASIDADCVVSNLPFGIRTGTDLRELYGAFVDRLREGDVGRLVALTTKPNLIPIEPTVRYDIPYGRLDAAIVVWEP